MSTKLRKQADRIKTILFLNEEFTYEQTAYLLMLDDMTVGAMKKNMGIFEQSPEKVK